MTWAPFLAPGRDGAFKVGRAKAGGTTFYTIPGASGVVLSTAALTLNRDYYYPFLVTTPIVIDQLACEVVTGASGNLRMGFYAADIDWQPVGAPLADSGSIAISVAVKTYTPSTPVFLPRGRYLGVVNVDTTSTFRAIRAHAGGVTIGTALGATGYVDQGYVARTYAAFPTPGTAWDTTASGGSGPFLAPIVYRVSTP